MTADGADGMRGTATAVVYHLERAAGTVVWLGDALTIAARQALQLRSLEDKTAAGPTMMEVETDDDSTEPYSWCAWDAPEEGDMTAAPDDPAVVISGADAVSPMDVPV